MAAGAPLADMSGEPGGEVPPASNNAAVAERVLLSDADVASMESADWAQRWRQQEAYVERMERRCALQEGELDALHKAVEKARGTVEEAQQRERLLVRRLTAKEQETHDLLCQLNELKTAQTSPAVGLRSTLLDPAVNLLLQQLKTELVQTRAKLEDTQNELTAWKFTPDSNTGKRLMAKCRLLYQENEELGKLTSTGRIAKLESDLALQKSFSEEVRQSQNELDSFLSDLDEDVEGMQSTILFLQTELRKSKELLAVVQKENALLKSCSSSSTSNNNRSNGDSSVCETEEENNRTRVKRMRRASVLSIDFEDEPLGGTNGDLDTD